MKGLGRAFFKDFKAPFHGSSWKLGVEVCGAGSGKLTERWPSDESYRDTTALQRCAAVYEYTLDRNFTSAISLWPRFSSR